MLKKIAGWVTFMAVLAGEVGCSETTVQPRVTTGTDQDVPLVYASHGGPQVEGADICASDSGLMIQGRVYTKSYCQISPSRVVRIDAMDESHNVIWTGSAAVMRAEKGGWQRSRAHRATFQAGLPDLEGVSHYHLGVVHRHDLDKPMQIDCELSG